MSSQAAPIPRALTSPPSSPVGPRTALLWQREAELRRCDRIPRLSGAFAGSRLSGAARRCGAAPGPARRSIRCQRRRLCADSPPSARRERRSAAEAPRPLSPSTRVTGMEAAAARGSQSGGNLV